LSGRSEVQRLQRIAIAAPSVLLCLIAAAQMILASTAGLSPWKGGGFGMFASVDSVASRRVRLYVDAAERSEEIEVPASLVDAADRVAAWPHRRALEGLAWAVAARERRHDRPVERVRVEVWRTEVSPALDVTEQLAGTLEIRVRDDHLDRRVDAAAPDTRHPPVAASR
jgi:hypothetical protein